MYGHKAKRTTNNLLLALPICSHLSCRHHSALYLASGLTVGIKRNEVLCSSDVECGSNRICLVSEIGVDTK